MDWSVSGRRGAVLDQQMHMIILAVHLDQLRLEIGTGLGEDDAQSVDGVAVEHFATVLRHKDQVDVHLENAVPPMPYIVVIAHRPRI